VIAAWVASGASLLAQSAVPQFVVAAGGGGPITAGPSSIVATAGQAGAGGPLGAGP
jgi:hypothetical protein